LAAAGGSAGQLALASLGLPSVSGSAGMHRGLTGPHANLMAHPLLGQLANQQPGGAGGLLSGAGSHHGAGQQQQPGSNIFFKLP